MLSHQGAERTFSHNAYLAIALSSVAGAVNASGFFVVGTYTSHVTGHVARLGDELSQWRLPAAEHAAIFFACFLAGAVSAAAVVRAARYLGRSRFALALGVEAALVALFGFMSGITPHPDGGRLLGMTGMLCFAMGLQNALVTNISGAVVRTTHLTGVTTDFGIELVTLAVELRRRLRAGPLGAFLRGLPQTIVSPPFHRAWLQLFILVSFVAGAVGGPALYLRVGNDAMYAPAALLVLLSGWDLFFGAGARFAAAPEAAPR